MVKRFLNCLVKNRWNHWRKVLAVSCRPIMGLVALMNCFQRSRIKEARLLALGLDNAGKTTLLKCLSGEDITNIVPTQGFVLKSMLRADFKLIFWDISGQRALRPYWRNYFLRIDALIYVVDCVDRRRIIEAGEELMQILEEEKLEKVPLLVFANKQDSVFALPANEAHANNIKHQRDGQGISYNNY
ncbi:hypothetical protein O6H91_20G055500 [Diphasiastrum complanatum]|uniref:Uncharacterized protein n=1 Tax=Diphasiastrum complanatum TaxID=34168 RepID=A0ACC2AQP1_DIPCM|nr:hypothetical protein O6H91_20G055500 [Diphasiastrum complanatum]